MFWNDFFPTPDILIEKMLSKINIKEHKNILDPSVWKWDILRYIKDKYRYTSSFSYYWIEIDYNLRELAKQYCNIIWFDFLDFKSLLNIDLILANFPFSEWDKHFLKAWEVLDKWEMVCILNAETIKNPYSKTRKMIIDILAENNAEVEYIENAFVDAERKTKVEIALIHIKKEKSRMDSIFENLEAEYINMYTQLWWDIKENELMVWNDKIDHMIRLCEIAKKEYINMYLALNKFNYYLDIVKKDNNIKFYWELFPKRIPDYNEWILEINKNFWIQWFQNTWIRWKITSKVYDDFIKDYENSNLDFNAKNIWVVKDIIMWTSWKIMEENFNTVFDIFTKYHPDNRVHIEGWEHNSAWMIWKITILPDMVALNYNWKIRGIKNTDHCRDIDKVFCQLSWKNYDNIIKLENIKDSWETEFFKVKMYKKWTLHLTFKDIELVKQFNLQICKNKKWIAPGDFKFKV